MEQGENKDYIQVDKIDRVRRANAQRHVLPTSSSSRSTGLKKHAPRNIKSIPDLLFIWENSKQNRCKLQTLCPNFT